MPAGWWLVVPVKDADLAKSRLRAGAADRAALALAFASDAVAAALRSKVVDEVIVVTSGRQLSGFRALGAHALVETSPGLVPAAGQGLRLAPPGAATAVMLGDLPCLRPEDLDRALTAALAMPRAFVPDADGTGSTLVTALPGVPHRLRFGPDSRRLHRAAGYRELAVPPDSGLRRDVDDLDQLAQTRALGWGRSTARVARTVGLPTG